jgi:hypothetical protein
MKREPESLDRRIKCADGGEGVWLTQKRSESNGPRKVILTSQRHFESTLKLPVPIWLVRPIEKPAEMRSIRGNLPLRQRRRQSGQCATLRRWPALSLRLEKTKSGAGREQLHGTGLDGHLDKAWMVRWTIRIPFETTKGVVGASPGFGRRHVDG